MNQMQEKVLAVLRAAAEGRHLDWVEVRTSACEGTVRLQQPGRFRTVLRLEYEFQLRSCRLLAYVAGQRAAGRCGIDYDEGMVLEQFLADFENLLPETDGGRVSVSVVPAFDVGRDNSRLRGRLALVQ